MDFQSADAAACGHLTGALCIVRKRCDGVGRITWVPHSVKCLPGLVDPLIGVRSEEVPLCLQRIAGQGSSRSAAVCKGRSGQGILGMTERQSSTAC